MKGHGTHEVLPSFVLLPPSLLSVMQSFLLQISGMWEGWWEMQQIFGEGFLGKHNK